VKLKPCPFCLNKKVEVVDFGNDDGEIEYAVCCENCGATGPNDISIQLASEMWNLRRIEHPKEEVIFREDGFEIKNIKFS